MKTVKERAELVLGNFNWETVLEHHKVHRLQYEPATFNLLRKIAEKLLLTAADTGERQACGDTGLQAFEENGKLILQFAVTESQEP